MTIERIPIDLSTPAGIDAWHGLRGPVLTASQVPALYGVSPHITLGRLWLEKAGHRFDDGPDPESSVIRRGRALEQVVANLVNERHPTWEIQKAQYFYRDAKRRMGATPDFLVIDHERDGLGVIQTKTVASSEWKKHWDEESCPLWISLQTTMEMLMTGASWGMVAALEIGEFKFELHEYPIARNFSVESRIQASVADFWHKLDNGIKPELDYERDGELISVLYPQHVKGKVLDWRLDNRALDLCETIELQKTLMDTAQAAKEAAENELKVMLADAEGAMVRGWYVTHKSQTRKAYVPKPVAECTYRVLRRKRVEENRE